MTITVADSFADQVLSFLKTLPRDAVTVEKTHPSYIDEVKHRVEEYKSGKMKTDPLDKAFWDEMDSYIDTVA